MSIKPEEPDATNMSPDAAAVPSPFCLYVHSTFAPLTKKPAPAAAAAEPAPSARTICLSSITRLETEA